MLIGAPVRDLKRGRGTVTRGRDEQLPKTVGVFHQFIKVSASEGAKR